MTMGSVQVPSQMAVTQQTAQAWPVQGMPGQAYSVWPPGQAADAHHPAQGTGMNTSHPMVLMQMPQRQ